MPDFDPRTQAERLLDGGLDRTLDWPESSSPLRRALLGCRERLRRPMRVAVAGLIKAGKSTLINALLGHHLVAVGEVVTTFNVNWLCYGAAPEVWVHFKPETNRPAERRPLGELEEVTRRGLGDPELLRSIRYVQVRYPHPLLREFEVIDTPGLESVEETDSANTREFLAMHGSELSECTRQETSGADAVLYLFCNNLAASDAASLEELQESALSGASPLNTVAVFSMADTLWPGNPDPLGTARQICARLQDEHPRLRALFYAVLPVAGLAALGAQTWTDEEVGTLAELARVGGDRLRELLGNSRRFCEREYPDMPAPGRRLRVLDRLGRWGVWQACELIRRGEWEPAGLARQLLEASGVAELRRLVGAHFGRRAALLKTHRVCHEVIRGCSPEKRRPEPARRALAVELGGDFERLLLIPTFDELRLLCRLYRGQPLLSPEETRQALALLGEFGVEPDQRLGVPLGSLDREGRRTLAEERRRYWQAAANDSLAAGEYRQASRVLMGGFESLLRSLTGQAVPKEP